MSAAESKPRIVIFSGPRATLQNSGALVTSRSRRDNPETTGYDAVRSQLLAAPATVYIEAFSGHPLEKDAAELYGPPDGYLDTDGAFSPDPTPTHTRPVYRATLRPEDGPYLLPYLATQPGGVPWDGLFATTGDGKGRPRQSFHPDASRIVADIDRFGIDGSGHNNLLGSLADFDFMRPEPSGGYTLGRPAAERTDVGEGDIPPEVLGEDYFAYAPVRRDPAPRHLARATNMVAEAMASGRYLGGIWLEGSPTTEETIYWLNLVVPTTLPLIGNSAQSPHGTLANDGDQNLVESTRYIVSRVWAGEDGRDRVGGVMIQNGQIFTAREVQKADARAGGYVATGGTGGVVGNTVHDVVLSFLPLARHTHTSDVSLDRMPAEVRGSALRGGAVVHVPVRVKDADGRLDGAAMPKVTVYHYVNYGTDDSVDGVEGEVEILARIARNLTQYPLAGFVAAGQSPYGTVQMPVRLALERAVMRGMPVVTVGRGGGGFAGANSGPLFIPGSNLTASKARILLMACLLTFGALPVPADPDNPTPDEVDAVRARVAAYKAVFDTH